MSKFISILYDVYNDVRLNYMRFSRNAYFDRKCRFSCTLFAVLGFPISMCMFI